MSRIWLVGALVCVMAGVWAAGAQAAEFGVESFFAGNCKTGFEACGEEELKVGPLTYSLPKEPTKAEAEVGGYTQAGGHPAVGVTAFKINTNGNVPEAAPTGVVTHVRTDAAPGVSVSPEAVPKCTMAEFAGIEVATGVFTPPACSPETEIGVNKVIVYLPPVTPKDYPLQGKVYNVVQPNGLSSLFGVALELPAFLTGGVPGLVAHTLIEGHIEWAGDYHDYYEINVSPAIPLIASRLSLIGDKGTTGHGGFVTNPSRCAGPGPLTSNTVTLMSSVKQEAARTFIAPIGPEGCLGGGSFIAPPFEPEFKLSAETLQRDQPDGITTEVVLPHDPSPTGIDTSQLRTATVTLPEGMTLNPSVANGLKACTPAEIGIKTRNPVTCPAESKIGHVTLTVPDLPATEPLEGNVYLGGGEPITGQPYTIYVDAESARYGISVRLQGTVTTNESTGRVTTVFAENPEQPFTDFKLSFNGGGVAPIANPLACGAVKTETSLMPYTGAVLKSPFSEFVVGNEKTGGACPSPLPFALAQSTEDHPTTGAANTSFTLNLSRPDGQQYLSRVSTTLPEGLVGKIPAVPRCGEPQASLGTCSSASQIGTATVNVGSGPTPTQFSGPVYLTGPYAGAPYGMTIVIDAAVGPFNLGPVVTRARIEVDEFTGRVTVVSTLPRIVKGIPLRLKTLSVAINRQGFLINPTNCGVLSTETLLTSTFGSNQLVSTPFQASGCSALPFKPKLIARTNAKASRRNGASLEVSVGYPVGPQANIKSVMVQLPKQLPSRSSTLNKACLEATFKANPYSCPTGSAVGGATATTPVLPEKLTGRAFFVSHGGAAFPDLDLVMSGNGLTIILVGNTNITKGITTTTFASIPDVPVSGFHLKLPYGRFSALAAHGNLCRTPLIMPTTITAQNGAVIKQRTRIAVSGCGVQILSHRVRGHSAILKLQVFSAGRLTVGGHDLRTVHRKLRKAGKLTVSVPLSAAGLRALAHHHPLRLRVRASFTPSKGHRSSASVGVVFR